jgi:hypothetical protein
MTRTTNPDPPARFTVFVDDNFHYMDPTERYREGEFDTYAAAVAACQAIVDDFLTEHHRPGMSAAELLTAYKTYGEDPFVVPRPPDGPSFSAWGYAEKRCGAMCAARG